jgi:hypothetical protein
MERRRIKTLQEKQEKEGEECSKSVVGMAAMGKFYSSFCFYLAYSTYCARVVLLT